MSAPILPRFLEQPIALDLLEANLQQIERDHAEAKAAVEAGHTNSDPTDAQALRGIPCLARNVSGTSPGTRPDHAILNLDHRLRYTPKRA